MATPPGYTRVHLDLEPVAAAVLDELANEQHIRRTTVIRQALGVYQAMRKATREGKLVGTTDKRENLDVVLVAPL
jgi:hypothetical protein